MAFQMAAIILRGKAGLEEVSDGFVSSEACQAMQRRVEVSLSPETAALGKDRIAFDIEVTMRDGQTHRQR